MARARKVQGKAVERDEASVQQRIARKAYELYEQRGGSSGRELDDWLEAERVVKQELSLPQANPSSSV
jgi:hypothetical protein